MVLTRSEFLRMMSVSLRSSAPTLGLSASNWPAWLMAPTGLRISCAMLADSRPRAASLLCCTRSAMRLVSPEKSASGPARWNRGARNAAESGGRRRPPRSSTAYRLGPALPPGAQGVEQTRRNLADQCSRDGVHVAQNLGSRFVDQTNLVGGIDDQQAFAQMLDDVLRQVGEVRRDRDLSGGPDPRFRARASPARSRMRRW